MQASSNYSDGNSSVRTVNSLIKICKRVEAGRRSWQEQYVESVEFGISRLAFCYETHLHLMSSDHNDMPFISEQPSYQYLAERSWHTSRRFHVYNRLNNAAQALLPRPSQHTLYERCIMQRHLFKCIVHRAPKPDIKIVLI